MNATKKHNQIAKATVAMLMMMLTIGLTSPVLAQEGASGSAAGGNLTAEVTSVTAPDSVDPQAEENFPSTVQDNNTLADIDNVVLKVFLTTAGEGAADAIENHYTFTFTAVDNVWTETGPGPDNDHLITTSCTYPSDLALQSDNYKFVIKLSAVATIGEWTAKWIATDDNNAEGSKTDTFSVTEYISMEIDDTTLTFSGNPGDIDIQPSPEQPTVCTVYTNKTFKISAKLSADWLGGTHGGTIGMENTEAARTAGKASAVTLSNAYAIVWTDVAPGEPVIKDIYWFLDLPVPLRDDVYTTTFYVQALTI